MSNQVERAVAAAMSKLGAPYVWATAGPDTFDCSGFTWWVACQVLGPQDYELRSSHHQFNIWGDAVRGGGAQGAIRAGDLVFFDVGQGTIMGNRAGHVGLMFDDEQMIHAANEQLGVRIDELDAPWYAPKFIGARRIFAPEHDPIEMSNGQVFHDPEPQGDRTTLPDIFGNVSTPNPWNGAGFGVEWKSVTRWGRDLSAAAAQHSIDVRLPAAVMMLETQGIHARNGEVIEVWDGHPADGPSVGLMQVKPWVWQYLVPAADAYDPRGNIRLGTAVLAHLIERFGSWARAIGEGYHPGVSPNGTTPARYVEAMRGLLGELGYAS
jgi:hypothetical protein